MLVFGRRLSHLACFGFDLYRYHATLGRGARGRGELAVEDPLRPATLGVVGCDPTRHRQAVQPYQCVALGYTHEPACGYMHMYMCGYYTMPSCCAPSCPHTTHYARTARTQATASFAWRIASALQTRAALLPPAPPTPPPPSQAAALWRGRSTPTPPGARAAQLPSTTVPARGCSF